MALFRFWAVTLMSATLALGCGKKKTDDPVAETGPYADLGLVGKWHQDCVADGSNKSSVERDEYSGSSVVETSMDYYGSATCETIAEDRLFRRVYSSATKKEKSDAEGWTTISSRFTEYTLELRNDAIVSIYNEKKAFGYSDWKVGEPRSVSGRQYKADSKKLSEVGRGRVNTIRVVGDELQFAKYKDDVALTGESDIVRFKRGE